VALVVDWQPVEAFGADGADEALGVGVRDGCPDRHLDDADPFVREDGVKGGCELTIAIRGVGAGKSIGGSCGDLVLVDESSKSVSAVHVRRVAGWSRDRAR
jgi:hypothetical protein